MTAVQPNCALRPERCREAPTAAFAPAAGSCRGPADWLPAEGARLAATAFGCYALYCDPVTGRRITAEQAIEHLVAERRRVLGLAGIGARVPRHDPEVPGRSRRAPRRVPGDDVETGLAQRLSPWVSRR